ncbi:MAG: hypothetical protein IT515_08105 [Burkholderiales bacterium]|nr:hypothetical protein [Burkholderiales bacterium]
MRALAVALTVASSGAAAEILRQAAEIPFVVFDPPLEPIRFICTCAPARIDDIAPELALAYGALLLAVGLLGYVMGRVKRIRSRISH